MKKFFLTLCLLALLMPLLRAQNKLSAELLWKMGRISDLQLSPDGKYALYGVTTYDIVTNKGNRDIYKAALDYSVPVKLTDAAGSEYNARWRPDGKKIGFLAEGMGGDLQMWEMNPDGSGKKELSSIQGGINGFDYAPDMKNIVFIKDVKLDSTVRDVYPDLPLADARIIDDLFYRHWDSWSDYSYSHVFIAPYADNFLGKETDIMAGEKFDAPLTPWGGMEQICWSPDGKKLLYTCRKLNGKAEAISTNSDIFLYDITSGKTVNLSEGMEGYDQDPVFSPNGSMVAWCSMKTPGYESDKKRLMLLDLSSKKMTDLTAGFNEGVSNLKWDRNSPSGIYFISGTRATFQVYFADIKTNQITQLTKGTHDYSELDVKSGVIAGVRMSMSAPSEIFVVNNLQQGGGDKQLTFVNREVLSTINMGKVEERWVTTSDNKKMLVWVIYPPDFDKNKKYPTLLYCQGGPQDAVSQFWSYRWNFQMMAAHGYIVVAPNRRGLPTFGSEWNDQIAQDYGGQNMRDYLTAIDTLSKEPYVDADHLGAVGASYGGYSVYWLAGHHQKRFKAFIAHCGMFNLESWYGSTEEYWFPEHDLGGAYWQKPEPRSYGFSPHKFVGNWDTPMLVIHGGNDFRIPYTEGMQAFNAAQLQGIPSRFLFFPNESHFVTKPQNSVLWQREFFRFLDQWLK